MLSKPSDMNSSLKHGGHVFYKFYINVPQFFQLLSVFIFPNSFLIRFLIV